MSRFRTAVSSLVVGGLLVAPVGLSINAESGMPELVSKDACGQASGPGQYGCAPHVAEFCSHPQMFQIQEGFKCVNESLGCN